MQEEEAAQLRDIWARKGNPPCDHSEIDKEYFKGSQGDYVCTACGKRFMRS